jgi:hypothetical protein
MRAGDTARTAPQGTEKRLKKQQASGKTGSTFGRGIAALLAILHPGTYRFREMR